jgi:hypothetical protein
MAYGESCSATRPYKPLPLEQRRRYMRAGYYTNWLQAHRDWHEEERRTTRDPVHGFGPGKLFSDRSYSRFALRFERSLICWWGVFSDELIPEHEEIIEYIWELARAHC